MPTHDSRLLTNLLKKEKDAIISFKAWTRDAASANAAMTAWSVADSSDTPDILDISNRISQLMSATLESQRAYIYALTAYRTSLKDVLDRQASVRVVVRDREILVNRLVKLGNKRPSDKEAESHQNKIDEAERELTACETFLQSEEQALSGTKRRTFQEALAMRMKAMAGLAEVMHKSANEAIDVLNTLGITPDFHPEDYDLEHDIDIDPDESVAGDSIAPSQSASQAFEPDYPTLPSHNSQSLAPRGRQGLNGSTLGSRPSSPRPPSMQSISRRAVSPQPVHPRIRTLSNQSSKPRMAPVPSAPRPASSYVAAPASSIPGFDIPKAPTSLAQLAEDSSDEELAPPTMGAGQQRSGSYPYESPSSSAVGGSRLRRRAMSDSSSDYGGPKARKRTSSFSLFGGLASLFKRKDKRKDDDDDYTYNPSGGGSWQTRTDRHVYTQKKANSGLRTQVTRPGNDSSDDEDAMPKNLIKVVNDHSRLRGKAMSDIGVPPSRMPTYLSQSNMSSSQSVRSGSALKKKKPKRAASDIGVAPSLPIHHPDEVPKTIAPPAAAAAKASEEAGDTSSTIKKKKKKKAEPERTIVLSAESLGIVPSQSNGGTAATTNGVGGLSRSNSVTSTGSAATTGTVKRKKKKAVAALEPTPEEETTKESAAPTITRTLPSADDLASSLPSAKSSYVPEALPLPPPIPTPSAPSKTSQEPRAATKSESAPEIKSDERVGSGKTPKALGDTVKKMKKDSALMGTNTWVSKPGTVSRHGKDATEGEASLMSIIDKAEGRDLDGAATSRSYATSAKTNGNLAGVGAGGAGGLQVPATGGQDGEGSPSRRKSVRLADAPSPPSSVRSETHSASAQPARGILVHHTPSPSAALVEQEDKSNAGWSTRLAGRNSAIDTSDSSDDDGEYKKARKAFGKATKSMDNAMTGRFTTAEKGKAKAS